MHYASQDLLINGLIAAVRGFFTIGDEIAKLRSITLSLCLSTYNFLSFVIVLFSLLTVDKETIEWMLKNHRVDPYRPWVICLIKMKYTVVFRGHYT